MSVYIEPVCTIRKTPSLRCGGGRSSKSLRSNPFGIETTGRSADSDTRARIRSLLPPRGQDCRRRAQQPAHAPQLPPAVHSAGIEHQLVQCPVVAEVGDPGTAELARESGGCFCSLVRRHGRDNDVDLSGNLETCADDTLCPPSRPGRGESEPPLSPHLPRRALGLAPLHPVDVRVAYFDLERLVARAPLVARRAGAGHDADVVPVLGQIAGELERTLDAAPADRREVIGENERSHVRG